MGPTRMQDDYESPLDGKIYMILTQLVDHDPKI